MQLKIYTEPTVEPVTVTELKQHLRLDSVSFADDVSAAQTLVPDNHAIAANYTLVGTGIDVLGYDVVVLLNSGTNGDGGTVDVKLQESDNNSTFTDVTSGAFTQVTISNDNAIQEKAYTGTKQYLRAVATVAGAACDFGVTVIKNAPTSAEDSLITSFIKVSRRICEQISNRALITQTWELALDKFPIGEQNYIELPRAPLQTVSSVKYYDTDETESTFSSADYIVNTYYEPGRIVLGYGEVWPTQTLRTTKGVIIRYVAGYGATAESVPEEYKQAIKLLAGHYYENRENTDSKRFGIDSIPFGVFSLLQIDRIIPI